MLNFRRVSDMQLNSIHYFDKSDHGVFFFQSNQKMNYRLSIRRLSKVYYSISLVVRNKSDFR